MTRKLFVRVIAVVYLAQGLWGIVSFFLPIFISPKPVSLDLSNILSGALGLWAGIYLFRFDEFGRKYVICLLLLRIAYNLFFIGWSFFQKDLSITLKYFGTLLFESKSTTGFVMPLLLWAGIALGTMLFLMQRDTKMIFVAKITSTEGSSSITNSISG